MVVVYRLFSLFPRPMVQQLFERKGENISMLHHHSNHHFYSSCKFASQNLICFSNYFSMNRKDYNNLFYIQTREHDKYYEKGSRTRKKVCSFFLSLITTVQTFL